MNRKFAIFMRLCLVILGVIFFPLGLFLLGYVIGNKKNTRKILVSEKNEAKLIEKEILKDMEEQNSDRVMID